MENADRRLLGETLETLLVGGVAGEGLGARRLKTYDDGRPEMSTKWRRAVPSVHGQGNGCHVSFRAPTTHESLCLRMTPRVKGSAEGRIKCSVLGGHTVEGSEGDDRVEVQAEAARETQDEPTVLVVDGVYCYVVARRISSCVSVRQKCDSKGISAYKRAERGSCVIDHHISFLK